MKAFGLKILLVLNVALLAALGWLWLTPQGQLRNVRWQAPAAIRPDFSQAVPVLDRQAAVDTGRFVAILDRPLFSPTRKPPPPVAVAKVDAPPPDPLANIQLLGLFHSGEEGGILARVDGRSRRVRLSELVGEWKLKAIAERDVTFVRGDETRVLKLERTRIQPPPAPVVAGDPGAQNAGAPPAAPGVSAAQRLEEEGRERLRRRNAIRAQAGLPPISQ